MSYRSNNSKSENENAARVQHRYIFLKLATMRGSHPKMKYDFLDTKGKNVVKDIGFCR